MKSLKSLFTWIIVALFCIGVGLGLNHLFFQNNKNFPFFGCGVTLALFIIDSLIANKLGYKLDIMNYSSDDSWYMLLNDILIGCICAIPLTMFISIIL